MEDIFKSKEHEFYIELKQERYFFPGEDISGDIILNLTKATKITNIKVVLEGNVEIGGRSMSIFSKYVLIAKPENGDKYQVLEPCTHRFPFIITIPTSKECKVPSTLEISKLLKINYQVTAILNKPYSFLEKLNASTTKSINILEDINVESEENKGEHKVEKKVYLTGEKHRPVTVSTSIGKRAAVKGDTIPISVTVEHIGVLVRDKAISVQLLRSVYYGKNKTELFGPKMIREVTSNIEISGPVSFTKEFKLKLAIPSNLCPTVADSSHAFRIEYTLQVSVNLNEENPYQTEVSQKDIVFFNLPFIVGTYPKLSFSIDDDDEDEDTASLKDPLVVEDDSSLSVSLEYDQVVEKMKEMDLELEPESPQLIQDAEKRPSPTTYSPLPALDSIIEPTYKPISKAEQQADNTFVVRKQSYLNNNEPLNPSSNEVLPSIPVPSATVKTSPTVKPLEKRSNSGSNMESFATPKMEFATNLGSPSGSSSQATSPIKSPSVVSASSNSSHAINHPHVIHTPPSENALPPSYHGVNTISPNEALNNFNPTLSPSPSIHRMESVSSTHSTHTASSIGRQQSFHWVTPPVQNTSSPTSPVLNNYPKNEPSPAPPALPPRPVNLTPSVSNHTGGFAMFPQPSIPPAPSPSFSSQTHHYPQQQQHYHQPTYEQPPYPGVSFPQAQQPPVTYNPSYQPPYNNNNCHQQHTNFAFPQPQPQPFMGMPSHHDYQPQQTNYPYFHN